MATDRQSIAIATTWLKGLADLCVHPGGEAPTAAKLHQMASQLCELVPSGVFTAAAARECAKGDFFPGFDTLQTRLVEWWQLHRPGGAPSLLPAGITAGDLLGNDLVWFNFWFARRSEAAMADDEARRKNWKDEAQLPLSKLASLVRGQSPRAWAAISGNQGTIRQPSEAEQDAVRESARRAIEAMNMPRQPWTPPAYSQVAALPAPERGMFGAISPELLEQRRAELMASRV